MGEPSPGPSGSSPAPVSRMKLCGKQPVADDAENGMDTKIVDGRTDRLTQGVKSDLSKLEAEYAIAMDLSHLKDPIIDILSFSYRLNETRNVASLVTSKQ